MPGRDNLPCVDQAGSSEILPGTLAGKTLGTKTGRLESRWGIRHGQQGTVGGLWV